MLSVYTMQPKATHDALKAKLPRFRLQGNETNLGPAVGCCIIIMSPGYLGCSERPEGLQALFQPITARMPDFKLIRENNNTTITTIPPPGSLPSLRQPLPPLSRTTALHRLLRRRNLHNGRSPTLV